MCFESPLIFTGDGNRMDKGGRYGKQKGRVQEAGGSDLLSPSVEYVYRMSLAIEGFSFYDVPQHTGGEGDADIKCYIQMFMFQSLGVSVPRAHVA